MNARQTILPHVKNTKSALAALMMVFVLVTIAGCQRAPSVEEELLDQTPIVFSTVVPTATATATQTAVVMVSPTLEPTESAPPVDGFSGEEQTGESFESQDGGGVIVTAAPMYTPSAAPIINTPDPFATPFVALSKGMSGDSVERLQRGLYELGYYTGTVDGDFGSQTHDAVSSFQLANGLTPDGVAGSRTIRAMNALLEVRAAPTYPLDTPAPITTPTPTPPIPEWTPLPTLPPTIPPQSTEAAYRTLNIGDSGADVRSMQERLKQLGYFTGTVNGVYASDTAFAVSSFQQNNRLPMDGIAGIETQRALADSYAVGIVNNIQKNTQSPTSVPSVTITPQTLIGATAVPEVSPTAAPSPLRAGNTGARVEELQLRLTELGYLAGNTSVGYYDAWTVEAVSRFQQRNGLASDGIAGAITLERLFADNALPALIYAPQPTAAAKTDASYPAGAIATIAPATGTLRLGSTGEDVAQIQQKLYALGYYQGSADGIFSAQVEDAVKRFQERNSLVPDGIAGTGTRNALSSSNPVPAVSGEIAGSLNVGTLQPGMRGSDVQALQEYLIRLGYLPGPATDYYGEQTKAAVLLFQQNNGLDADGIAGAKTLSLLSSSHAVTAGGGTPTPPPTAPPITPAPTATAAGDNTLRLGDTGTMVVALQERLYELAYLSGSADGQYGAETQQAVRAFQQNHGLSVTGVADETTQRRLYSSEAAPMATPPTGNADLPMLDNTPIEQLEQKLTGALQSNLSGGGIAAISPSDSVTYYANGAVGGALYSEDATRGSVKMLDDPVRFLHAHDGALYFATNGQIARYTPQNGKLNTIVTTGYIKKMSMLNDVFYYLEGSTLFSCRVGDQKRELARDVNDFCVDVQNGVLYVATAADIKLIDTAGRQLSTVISTGAQQVLQCGGALHFLKDGTVYRISAAKAEQVIGANVSWFGFYKTKMYYIAGSTLFVCDTNGANTQSIDQGPVATVSFLAGYVCTGSTSGGGMNRKAAAPGQ
ncbi:MAG: peptidoglycan-binding protein [Oscillospiraceae bacterium]|nr:peptidoglycan-binding protein [Oscillospiraceae bacterium]